MRPLLTPWRLLAAFLLLLLVLLGVAAQQFRLFERGLFILQEWRHASEWRERSIWLPDYRVDIEARPIEGLVDDVSALTYDPDNRENFATWVRVFDRVAAGEMPPKKKPRPAPADLVSFKHAVATSLTDFETEATARDGRAIRAYHVAEVLAGVEAPPIGQRWAEAEEATA